MTYRNGIKEYGLIALIFGGIMGIFFGILYVDVIFCIIGGACAGVLFALLMLLFIKVQEKKFARMREEISRFKTVICDGGATLNGNGGWLFFTSEGLEFHAHAINLDTRSFVIPMGAIRAVGAKFNRITIETYNAGNYDIVVNRSRDWKASIDGYISGTSFQ